MSRPDRPQPAPLALTIAIVTETYPPEINGVANTMYQLVSGLQQRGHRLTLIRPRQQGESWPREAHPAATPAPVLVLVPGLPIPGYRGLRFGLPVYWQLRRRWRRARPDAVYIATQGPLGHAALHTARMARLPVLTGFHTQFDQYTRYYGVGLLKRFIVDGLRRFHNRGDATLVPTAALEQQLERDGFENLEIFSRGVDTRRFSPAHRSADLRRAWGCGDDTLVVLYVGRIAAEKNIALAVMAYQVIAAACPHSRAVFVGDGPELPRLRREHPEFVFTGARVGADLATHYASADLFLFPSLTETFGNVVTEAMASGLPVVAFDYAAAREHLRHGQTGYTVPRGDAAGFIATATAAAVARPGLARIGAAARQQAESLSWERVIRGVEQRLLEVIQRHSDPDRHHETMAATTE
ncbi:MAG: glycosyltransferase family 1 protein [Chromatiaceae bacterium]|nr:MAG: glycosyltransferase family 1 protein [Chromatiaceae bacterium]